MSQEYTVIVVGAGISGLAAARCLQKARIRYVVLEARDRVGGRLLTKRDSKIKYVDIGGAYLGVTQDRLLRISKELGIENYKINEIEDPLHYKNGRRKRFTSFVPSRRNPFASMDINNIIYLMDKMGKEIPTDAPWDAPHANEWDTMTYKEFLLKHCWTKEGLEFFSAFININITSESYEASLLGFLWYVKQCGGVKRIFSTSNGGQERKFVGGTQQLCEKMADLLDNPVALNQPVVGINQEGDNVIVKTLDGSEYKSQYIIVATPPAVQMKIHYNPPLPPLRNQLIQRMPMGSVIKCIIYYQTTFWREKGFSGTMLIEGDDNHPAFLWLDDTKPDGSLPALITFILADKSRRLQLLSKEERLQRLCKSVSEATGCPEGLKPIHYEEKNWNEEQYSGGCYTAMYPPGLLTRYGRVIRTPVGRMYFAGTETATEWSGYIEGGIQAGERAAREILFELGKIRKDEIWQKEPESSELKPLPFESTFLESYMPSVPGFLKYVSCLGVIGTVATIALMCGKQCKFSFQFCRH